MQIDITTEAHNYISQKIIGGDYKTPQEVIDHAISLLKKREDSLLSLDQKLRVGMIDAENGRFVSEEQLIANFAKKGFEVSPDE